MENKRKIERLEKRSVSGRSRCGLPFLLCIIKVRGGVPNQ